MSDLVFLRHPDLPADQWIEVPPEARVHYSTSGWQLVPDQDVAARDAAAAHRQACVQAAMAGLPEPPAPDAAPPADVGPDQDAQPPTADAGAADAVADAEPGAGPGGPPQTEAQAPPEPAAAPTTTARKRSR